MRNTLFGFLFLLLGLAGATGPALAEDAPETLPLTIGGSYSVTVADLEKMPVTKIVTKTPFMPGVTTFEGVLLRDLLKAAKLDAPLLSMTALNDYAVEVPAEDAQKYDVIVAYKVDGQYMRVRDKGPFWLIYPLDQHPELQNEATSTKMIWQIKSIDAK
jgi:hypothetical protein